MRAFVFCSAAVIVASVALSAHARDATPLPTADQSPLSVIFGLPAIGATRALSSGTVRASVGYEVSNYIFYNDRASESLVLDGETKRLRVSVVRGFRHGELGIELPYLSHSAGSFDGFIRRWHNTFGQRQGDRTHIPDYLFRYRYQRNGSDRVLLDQRVEGVGDIRLTAARDLLTHGAVDMALRASLKLPTGDSTRLLGSGAADLALWLSAGCSAAYCDGQWAWNAGGGILWLGKGEVLPEIQRDWAAFANLGLAWTYWTPVTFKTALYVHTPFYQDSEFVPLTETSVQLILGGTWRIGHRVALDLGVTEDLAVYTAPDVGVFLNLRADF